MGAVEEGFDGFNLDWWEWLVAVYAFFVAAAVSLILTKSIVSWRDEPVADLECRSVRAVRLHL